MFAKALNAVGGGGKRKRDSKRPEESVRKQSKAAVEIQDEKPHVKREATAPPKSRRLLTHALHSLGQEGNVARVNRGNSPAVRSKGKVGNGGCGDNDVSGDRMTEKAKRGIRLHTSLFNRTVADLGLMKERPGNACSNTKKHIDHGKKSAVTEIKRLKLIHGSDISMRSVIVSGFVAELEEKARATLLHSMLQGYAKRPTVHWITGVDVVIIYNNESDALMSLQCDINVLLRKSLLRHFEDNNFKHADAPIDLEKLVELGNRRVIDLKNTVTNRVIKNSLGLKISLTNDVDM